MLEMLMVWIKDMLDKADSPMFFMCKQGFFEDLNDWPNNPWVEDVNHQWGNRVFREEWEAVQFSKWIGDDNGDDTCHLKDFDHRPDEEDEDGDYQKVMHQ